MPNDWKISAGIFAAMAAVSACDWAWRAHKKRKSETWPIVEGVVTGTAVHQGYDDVTLTIRYSYPVEGEPYPIPSEFQKTFPFLKDEDEAQKWADALDHKNIPVRFDPSNNWGSVLWESDLEPIVFASAGDMTTKPH